MTPEHHPWKRFWRPRAVALSASDGYLPDPEGEWGSVLAPEVRSFEEIAETPCLALLGEPGAGKSTALRGEFELRARHPREQGQVPPVWIDLREYGSETRLLDALRFHPGIQAWSAGTETLDLFLDSYDECRLRIDTLATLLPTALEGLDRRRLRLRIACRSGAWPQTLEQALSRLFSEDACGVADACRVYELAPLREVDVAVAASDGGLDASEFLREIGLREVEALASRPITLRFLIDAKRKEGILPRSKLALYDGGVRRHASELNPHRLDAGRRGALDADARLEMAMRIAAVTLFSNRAGVWAGTDADEVPPDFVTLAQLRGAVPGEERQRDTALLEVLATGLFSSAGASGRVWAHQTFAEFLAARYVVAAGLEDDQILGLLTSPGDPEGRLVPQLQETAAWVATMRPSIFDDLVVRDPEALLRGDLATSGDAQREVLAGALLAAYDDERLVEDGELQGFLHKLSHPRLASQLRPSIVDPCKGLGVRRTAVHLAEACDLRELQDELVAIALDVDEPGDLREAAASAVAAVAESVHRARLRPLLALDAREDPDDQLLGHALQVLWPDHVGVEELFRSLRRPRRPNFYGQYEDFVHRHLPARLRDVDLPAALRWVRDTPALDGAPRELLGHLADEILVRCWASAPADALLEDFAEIAARRIANHEDVVHRELRDELHGRIWADEPVRRRLVTLLLARVTRLPSIWDLWNPGFPFLGVQDREWLLAWIVAGEASPAALRNAAEALHRGRVVDDPTLITPLLQGYATSSVLREVFRPEVEPVALDSPEADRLRAAAQEDQLRRVRAEARAREEAALTSARADRVGRALQACENSGPQGFWRLATALSRGAGGQLSFTPRLDTTPGWTAIDDPMRARILEAARRSVRALDPEPDRWVGTDRVSWSALAGYQAIRLLLAHDPAFVANLAQADWSRWAATIVAVPSSHDDRDAHADLACRSYRQAPDEALRAVRAGIESDVARHQGVFGLSLLDGCWDARLSALVLEYARTLATPLVAFQELLVAALSRGDEEAIRFGLALVEGGRGDNLDRAALAGALLLIHAPIQGWDRVREAMACDREFGHGVLAALAQRPFGGMLAALSEADLAALYREAVEWRPYPDKEADDGDGWRSYMYDEPRLRDGLLEALTARGTFEAARAIEGLMRDLPQLDWLRYTVHRARTAARSRTWAPPSPGEVLALSGTRGARLVRSGRELREAVVASLRRLEAKLQLESQAAIDLWNAPVRRRRDGSTDDTLGRYNPKDEAALSNYVKRHLEGDLTGRGVIVNREVEISPGEGDARGERTDIHVNAVFRDDHGRIADKLTVVVETKGCWNPHLFSEMETQLVGRYLRNNGFEDGIYLVGWYDCPQWIEADRGRRGTEGMMREEVEQRLREQASSLSIAGVQVDAFVLNCALRA